MEISKDKTIFCIISILIAIGSTIGFAKFPNVYTFLVGLVFWSLGVITFLVIIEAKLKHGIIGFIMTTSLYVLTIQIILIVIEVDKLIGDISAITGIPKDMVIPIGIFIIIMIIFISLSLYVTYEIFFQRRIRSF